MFLTILDRIILTNESFDYWMKSSLILSKSSSLSASAIKNASATRPALSAHSAACSRLPIRRLLFMIPSALSSQFVFFETYSVTKVWFLLAESCSFPIEGIIFWSSYKLCFLSGSDDWPRVEKKAAAFSALMGLNSRDGACAGVY